MHFIQYVRSLQEETGMLRPAIIHARQIVQAIAVRHVLIYAQIHALPIVGKIALEGVKMVAQQDVRQLVRVNAKKNALQLVLIPVRPRHHNIVQIVPATVLLDVLPHVLILARLRHRKAVIIVHQIVVVSVVAVASPIVLVVVA